MSTTVRLLAAGIVSVSVLASATKAGATSFVWNGDFPMGVAAFTSAYAFNDHDCRDDGSYAVVDQLSVCRSLWEVFGDYTTIGIVKMRVVNGAIHLNVWSEDGELRAHTRHLFSMWVGRPGAAWRRIDTDLDGDDPPDDLAIDGVLAPGLSSTAVVVPEPATMTLVGIGFLAVAMTIRRRRRA